MEFKDPHAPIETIPIKERGAFARWRKIKLTPIADRFWKKVDKRGPDECWPFVGEINNHGYGVFSPFADHVGRCLAHRKAWEVTNGPIPNELDCCHHCDNPPCCNPSHLFVGTHADNMADRVRKGRSMKFAARGERIWSAKLTESHVREIRRIYSIGGISHRKLGILFGMSKSGITGIISGRKWRHIA